MTLQEFQTVIDGMNASVTSISTMITNLNTQVTNLNTELAGTLNGTDAQTVLNEITATATALAALLPKA